MGLQVLWGWDLVNRVWLVELRILSILRTCSVNHRWLTSTTCTASISFGTPSIAMLATLVPRSDLGSRSFEAAKYFNVIGKNGL
jgi:hypothetical protein